MVGCMLTAGEIDRQNRITQQILAQFLQRRLFPNLSTTPTPSSNALLRLSNDPRDHHLQHHRQAHEVEGDDRLETVESEQISNVYFTSEGDLGSMKWPIALHGGSHTSLSVNGQQIVV
jgi:hypothetical protein